MEASNPNAPRRDYWFLVRNMHSETARSAPAQGIIEIYGKYTDNILTGRRPAYSGLTRIAVVPHAIAALGTGRCYGDGHHYVYVSEVVVAGDRIGPKRNTWYAQKDDLGCMLVEEVVATAGGLTTVLARFDRRRGDHEYARNNGGTFGGPWATVIFGSPYTVAAPSLGIASIT